MRTLAIKMSENLIVSLVFGSQPFEGDVQGSAPKLESRDGL